jgi:hypothetical protein
VGTLINTPRGGKEMKALKLVMVLVAVTAIMSTLVVAQAQAVWVTCYVNAAGVASTTKYVSLTDSTGTVPAVNRTWYTLSNQYSGANVMLSTALSAMISGMKVNVNLADTAAYSNAISMYLLDN